MRIREQSHPNEQRGRSESGCFGAFFPKLSLELDLLMRAVLIEDGTSVCHSLQRIQLGRIRRRASIDGSVVKSAVCYQHRNRAVQHHDEAGRDDAHSESKWNANPGRAKGATP